MANIALMDFNCFDDEVFSSSWVSSEAATFEFENVLARSRRSRTWHSAGGWLVTASNKTIIFRETTGLNLYAYIAEGEYTSDTTFFAAIKAALEVYGASTYSVSRDTVTAKIKITSNGVGGGGIFELRWTASTGAAALLVLS